MNLLLDTATFLWWVSGDDAVTDAARTAVADPTRRVFLSVISVWEIAVKHALQKLHLGEPPDSLIPRTRAEHGFEKLPLRESAVFNLSRLPELHRDPFDRMLVCQAIEHGLTIVTPDDRVRAYPVRTLW